MLGNQVSVPPRCDRWGSRHTEPRETISLTVETGRRRTQTADGLIHVGKSSLFKREHQEIAHHFSAGLWVFLSWIKIFFRGSLRNRFTVRLEEGWATRRITSTYREKCTKSAMFLPPGCEQHLARRRLEHPCYSESEHLQSGVTSTEPRRRSCRSEGCFCCSYFTI